jgi:hypothetical protein
MACDWSISTDDFAGRHNYERDSIAARYHRKVENGIPLGIAQHGNEEHTYEVSMEGGKRLMMIKARFRPSQRPRM